VIDAPLCEMEIDAPLCEMEAAKRVGRNKRSALRRM